MKKKIKAPKAIDVLKMIEFLAEDYSLKFGTDPEKHNSDEGKFVSKLYRLAHVGTKPSCLHVHTEWIKEAEDLLEYFKQNELI